MLEVISYSPTYPIFAGSNTVISWASASQTNSGRELENAPIELKTALQSWIELNDLKSDWDSYGARPPSKEALALSLFLIFSLYIHRRPNFSPQFLPYEMSPIADGGILLEWRSNNRAIEVAIDPRGKNIGYLLISNGQQRSFEENHHVPLPLVKEAIIDAIHS